VRRAGLIAALAACFALIAIPAGAQSRAHVAVGEATYGVIGVELRAVDNPDGTFGSWDLYRADTGFFLYTVDVDCLYVEGNVAYVTGPIRSFPPGVNGALAIEDNGDGPVTPDRLVAASTSTDCKDPSLQTSLFKWLRNVETGHLVVK